MPDNTDNPISKSEKETPTNSANPTSPTSPASPSKSDLQEELTKYQKAIKEEFELRTADTPENAPEAARDYFRKNLSLGMAQIVYLAQNAESETVRLNASKCIVNEALREAASEGDPVKQILTQLMNPVELAK